jgi:hypothetical protein
MGLPSWICQVETAGEGGYSVDPAYANVLPYAGWSVLFAAHEVGRTSVLCRPTYVRHVKLYLLFFFLLIF